MTSNDIELATITNIRLNLDTRVNNLENDVAELKGDIKELKNLIINNHNELKAELKRVNASIVQLEKQQIATDTRVEMLQHTLYWGLALLAIIAAIVPLFKRDESSKQVHFFHHSWLSRKNIPWARR